MVTSESRRLNTAMYKKFEEARKSGSTFMVSIKWLLLSEIQFWM